MSNNISPLSQIMDKIYINDRSKTREAYKIAVTGIFFGFIVILTTVVHVYSNKKIRPLFYGSVSFDPFVLSPKKEIKSKFVTRKLEII